MMGSAIAANLLAAGHAVTVWNRCPDKAADLVAHRARRADSPAAAAADADVMITMLSDGAAVNAVGNGPEGALPALAPKAVWVQMSGGRS
jgi:3-hydroxyisobutyrate dehydrogenase